MASLNLLFNPEEMFGVAQLVAHQPPSRGRLVAIVGNSDVLGLLADDAAGWRSRTLRAKGQKVADL